MRENWSMKTIGRSEQKTRSVLDAGVARVPGGDASSCPAAVRGPLRRPSAGREGRPNRRAGHVRTLIYFAEACVLLEWTAELGIDHIHTHYATNSATAAMFCRVLGGPTYSFTMHGPEEFDAPRATCLREKIHHARFVVAISEFTRSQLYRWADYRDWSKIHVVHVGVSPMFLDHGPGAGARSPRLVNIGRIVEQKGQAILIQAAAQLRDREIDFELVIVGDGPMRR